MKDCHIFKDKDSRLKMSLPGEQKPFIDKLAKLIS